MFTECSAKTGHNIEEMFVKLGEALPKFHPKQEQKEANPKRAVSMSNFWGKKTAKRKFCSII